MPVDRWLSLRLIAEPLGDHGEVHLVLKTRVFTADEKIDIVGKHTNDRLDPAALALGKIAQHVVLYQILLAGMTNANAHTTVIVSDMLD